MRMNLPALLAWLDGLLAAFGFLPATQAEDGLERDSESLRRDWERVGSYFPFK